MSERRTAAVILAECEAKSGGATAGEHELARLLAACEAELTALRARLAALEIAAEQLKDDFLSLCDYACTSSEGSKGLAMLESALQTPAADLREKIALIICDGEGQRAEACSDCKAKADLILAKIAKGGQP